jgi:hypothetical protein
LRVEDRIRLWELVETLDHELTSQQPDWKVVRASARELWRRVRRMTGWRRRVLPG